MENIEIATKIENKGNKNKSFKFKYMTSEDTQEIYILGAAFVNNNKDKCNLIIDDNINCELREKYRFYKKGEHSITLVINDENINFSNLFKFEFPKSYDLYDQLMSALAETERDPFPNNFELPKKYNNLIDASSLENLDTSECIDLSYMFYGCHLIKDFNFIKNWDISKCKYFKGIFSFCSFKNLDFLLNWNLKNAITLENMFYGCIYLNDIKDIKNWDVKNVENFSGMFYCCESLIDANDLQNWNMSNAIDINFMFGYCKKLLTVDSLYKWKLNDKINKLNIIYRCNKLLNIPTIFKNTSEPECQIY